MGFLDKLRERGRGVVTAAKPAEGVEPADEADVRRRLLGISGKGIETGEDGGEVVVAWYAKVAVSALGTAGYENLYRAFRIELDPSDHTAAGICVKTATQAEVGVNGELSGSTEWERGQHLGSETLRVMAWLGPHHTEGGAGEEGFTFNWASLREAVIEAVTGAGWTYKPKKV
jgi:hypothetical protein